MRDRDCQANMKKV